VNEIARIIAQLEQQRGTIDRAISALREVAGPGPAVGSSVNGAKPAEPKKRRLSAAGRRRIAAAARKRWAEKRAADAAQAKNAAHASKAASPKKAARKKRAGKSTAARAAA
jgi:hypothetical protein